MEIEGLLAKSTDGLRIMSRCGMLSKPARPRNGLLLPVSHAFVPSADHDVKYARLVSRSITMVPFSVTSPLPNCYQEPSHTFVTQPELTSLYEGL